MSKRFSLDSSVVDNRFCIQQTSFKLLIIREKTKFADNGVKSTIGKYPISIPNYREVSGNY